MRVCVVGAGAVGGHVAGRLAAGGADLAVIARGAHLEAIRSGGLRVDTPEGALECRPVASDDPASIGRVDAVVVAVKAPALPGVAEAIAPLLGAETPVVFVTNGIPWWYSAATEDGATTGPVARLDPSGAIRRTVGIDRAVGAVIHTACTVTAPGVVRVQNPRNRLVIGRPDGRNDPAVEDLAAMLRAGGLEVEVTFRIRDAVWEKLLMNFVGGSIAILTSSAMGDALADEALFAAARRMTDEAVATARALGCEPGDPTGGLARLRSSRHRQSILQDLEAGRAMEVDALLAVPLEMARAAGVAVPTSEVIVGLAIQRARAAGLYGPQDRAGSAAAGGSI